MAFLDNLWSCVVDVKQRIAMLESFAVAWSGRDIEALMALMAPNCEFRSSVGPEPGTWFSGRNEVRRGFTLFLAAPTGPVVTTENASSLVSPDFAVTRWTTRSPQPDGSVLTSHACDIFEFDGLLIRFKDTYRKVVGVVPSSAA